ncbi:MAG: class II aldolase/adducin family protein [Burkholderiaceae bacterium]|nr:class II aldolase/adducin family protein [Burkholderiaceae bacterium]
MSTTTSTRPSLAPSEGARRRDMSDAEWKMRCDLAALYRLAAIHGWGDLLATHISARVPDARDQFLINPYGMLFEEITASSLVKVDEHGKVLSETDYIINPAGFVIHSCIHVARPDIDCVMHLHTRDGTAVATQAGGLLPATQHALVIYDQVTYHDFEGPALDPDEQSRLVADLGDKRIMILRNHGTLAAGRTVGEAFVLMYRIERACRMQIAAQSGGQPLYPLPQSVIDKSIECGRTIFSKSGFAGEGHREWAAMLRKLQREGSDHAR